MNARGPASVAFPDLPHSSEAHPLSNVRIYLLIAAGLLLLDVWTGPFLMFPILFIVPVTLAGWYRSFRFAAALAIGLPLGRYVIAIFIEQPAPPIFALANAGVRVAVLIFIAYLVSRTAQQTRALEHEVRLLEGILPICMFCKRIRDEQQEWQPLEGYIAAHSEAEFTHGLCPECSQAHYGKVVSGKRTV